MQYLFENHHFSDSELEKHICCAVKADVICRESMMKVEVEKTDYFGNHEDHFQLNNGANTVCEIQSNSTHIYVDVPLNACGTLIEVTLACTFQYR